MMGTTTALLLALLLSVQANTQSADLATRSRDATRAMEGGRFDEAVRIYRDLLRALPDDSGLLMNLGMALAMGGREKEAIVPLERALALKPDLVPARLFLGSSYLALGQPEKAIAPLKRVVSARPADAESRRMLAQAYATSGRPTDAAAELRTVTELAPGLPGGWYGLGHAYNAVTQDAISRFGDQPEDSPAFIFVVNIASRFVTGSANGTSAPEEVSFLMMLASGSTANMPYGRSARLSGLNHRIEACHGSHCDFIDVAHGNGVLASSK